MPACGDGDKTDGTNDGSDPDFTEMYGPNGSDPEAGRSEWEGGEGEHEEHRCRRRRRRHQGDTTVC